MMSMSMNYNVYPSLLVRWLSRKCRRTATLRGKGRSCSPSPWGSRRRPTGPSTSKSQGVQVWLGCPTSHDHYFISDAGARRKVLLATDKQVINEIMMAAAKRMGMTPLLNAKASENRTASSDPRSQSKGKTQTQRQGRATSANRKKVDFDDKKPDQVDKQQNDESDVTYKLDASQFSIPVAEVLLPGDTGVMLVMSKEKLEHTVERCQGSGNAIVVSSDKWEGICDVRPIACRLGENFGGQ